MLTTDDFFRLTQWSAIATVAFALLAVLGFFLQWGIRYRLVGVSGFMMVLTGGLFALSLVPIIHTEIPGAVHFSLVYDNGSSQTVIAVPPDITESQLEATMRQAASDLFSPGRFSRGEDQLTIRVRTIIHPETGVSKPLYVGEVKRSLSQRDDEQMSLQIFHDELAQLPQPTTNSTQQ